MTNPQLIALSDKQLQGFLERVDLKAPISATREGLHQIQEVCMLTLPFENLDVYHRIPLQLGVDDLFDKIVLRQRGGYCFELNTLYAAALLSLGFTVQRVLARVWLRDPVEAPTRNHLAHLVSLNGRLYLTDVGFGGFTARTPLDLGESNAIDDGEGLIRLRTHAIYGYMLERKVEDDWKPQYSFDLSSVTDQDVLAANFWMEQHPKSHFRENRFVARFTPQGRLSLFELELSERVGTRTVAKRQLEPHQYEQVLAAHFGISL